MLEKLLCTFSLSSLSVLALLLLVQCAGSKSCAVKQKEEKEALTLQQFENEINHLVAQNTPPSLSVLVVKNDSIVYSKAFGYADYPNKIMATPQSTYQWWSLTKLFTATAILQLQEQGLLNINDPVQQHLPFFKVTRKRKPVTDVTIKHLLPHSSGLDDIGMQIIGWIHYEDDQQFNQTSLVKEYLPDYRKLKALPGEKGMYSNLGYMVLAAIIEEVSGLTYDNYITSHILTPLNMNHTGFIYRDSVLAHAAVGSHPKDFMSLVAFTMLDRKKAIRQKMNGIYWFNNLYSNQQGSTGLIGSAVDFSRFMIAMLNNGIWNGQKILSPESIQLMHRSVIHTDACPAPKSIDAHFGLSWFIHQANGQTALSHGGAGAAFVCQTRLYPDSKLGIVVMANSTYLGKDMGTSIINKLASLKW